MIPFNLPREASTSIPEWVLDALPTLSNASDIKILMHLARKSRYRRSEFGPGEISDATGLDYRTTTASLSRLGTLGYIVSANGVHSLRGACTSVAQALRKSTPTQQGKNTVQNGENEKVISRKDLKGLNRTSRTKTNPPTPQGEARDSTAPDQGTVTFPEVLNQLPGFTDAWTDWLKYRRTRRATTAPQTLTAQLGMLATQPDPIAVIRQSIEKGWQGLFPLKGNTGSSMPKANELDDQDWAAEAAEADRRNRFLNDETLASASGWVN